MTQDGRNSTDRFDGAVAVDDFGNIHIVYMRRPPGGGSNDIMYARSVDGGASFIDFRQIVRGTDVDKPWVAVGPDPSNAGNEAVWLTYTNSSAAGNQKIFVTGTTVAGLGIVGVCASGSGQRWRCGKQLLRAIVGPNGNWLSPG
jgi:hypothetical protein